MSLEALRKKHQKLIEENNNEGGEFLDNFFQAQMGDNQVRILPWLNDEGQPEFDKFYAETAIHRIEDDEGNTFNFHCLAVKGMQCPVCELYFGLWKKHKALKLPRGEKSPYGNLATKIKARPRFYLNVIDRRAQEAGEEKVVKILSTGKKLMALIMNALFDEDLWLDDNEDYNLLHMEKGNDFVVNLKKVKDFNNYDESKPRYKKTPAVKDKAEFKKVLDQQHEIHGLVKEETPENIEKVTGLIKTEISQIEAQLKGTPDLDTKENLKKASDDSDEAFESKLET